MASGKKTGGKDWPKGKSGNPAGYKGLTDLQLTKHSTRDEILKSMCSLLMKPMREVHEIASRNTPTEFGFPETDEDREEDRCADALMAAVISKAVVMGCPSRLNYIFQHIIGRPQTVEEIDVQAEMLLKKQQKAAPDIAAILGEALPGAQPTDLMQLFHAIQKVKANATPAVTIP
jgi:hypothetical protein